MYTNSVQCTYSVHRITVNIKHGLSKIWDIQFIYTCIEEVTRRYWPVKCTRRGTARRGGGGTGYKSRADPYQLAQSLLGADSDSMSRSRKCSLSSLTPSTISSCSSTFSSTSSFSSTAMSSEEFWTQFGPPLKGGVKTSLFNRLVSRAAQLKVVYSKWRRLDKLHRDADLSCYLGSRSSHSLYSDEHEDVGEDSDGDYSDVYSADVQLDPSALYENVTTVRPVAARPPALLIPGGERLHSGRPPVPLPRLKHLICEGSPARPPALLPKGRRLYSGRPPARPPILYSCAGQYLHCKHNSLVRE